MPQAGGKDGVVSVFGSRQLEGGQLPAGEGAPPLLSGKLHRGWVSDVQFVSQSATGEASASGSGSASAGGLEGPTPLLLLTAGNDGQVCLWDLRRSAEMGGGGSGGGSGMVPQCLAQEAHLHSGELAG